MWTRHYILVRVQHQLKGLANVLDKRYWSAGLLTISHVLFCTVEPGRHRRNAYTRTERMSSIATMAILNIG